MSFESLKCQSEAVEAIKGSIRKDIIFSSYLFAGPDGPGKMLAAINFAKALNCQNQKSEEPCDKCASCGKIDSGLHPDVIILEPKGASLSIGIGDVKYLISRAGLKPLEGRKKIFIIKNAESMNEEAGNAFLKTLEEPSPSTIFLLIAASKDALLDTVASRCHVVKFRLVLSDTEEGAGLRKRRILDAFTGTNGDLNEALSSYKNRSELKENLRFLMSFLRDMLVFKETGGTGLFLNIDRKTDAQNKANEYETDELNDLVKKITELESYVDLNVNPKIMLDVLGSKLRR